LCLDRQRASIATLALIEMTFSTGSFSQIATIALGGVAGLALCRSQAEASPDSPPFPVSRGMGAGFLALFFVLLAGANLLLFYVTGMSKAVDRLEAGEEAPPLAKFFAGASLFLWIAVMYFARLIPSGKFQP